MYNVIHIYNIYIYIMLTIINSLVDLHAWYIMCKMCSQALLYIYICICIYTLIR